MSFCGCVGSPLALESGFIDRGKGREMKAALENAPSKTGNPSGGGRGNNPPGKK